MPGHLEHEPQHGSFFTICHNNFFSEKFFVFNVVNFFTPFTLMKMEDCVETSIWLLPDYELLNDIFIHFAYLHVTQIKNALWNITIRHLYAYSP